MRKAFIVNDADGEKIARNARLLSISQAEYMRRVLDFANVALADCLTECIETTGSAEPADFRRFTRTTTPTLRDDIGTTFAMEVLHTEIFSTKD